MSAAAVAVVAVVVTGAIGVTVVNTAGEIKRAARRVVPLASLRRSSVVASAVVADAVAMLPHPRSFFQSHTESPPLFFSPNLS